MDNDEKIKIIIQRLEIINDDKHSLIKQMNVEGISEDDALSLSNRYKDCISINEALEKEKALLTISQ